MLTRSSQQLNAVPHQTIINNMYRIANIVLFVLAIFMVMGCSCSKTLCERNIQDDILNIDKFRNQSKKEYRYIEEDAIHIVYNGLTRSCVQQLTWLVTNYYLEGIR